jgi:hypothetical protein
MHRGSFMFTLFLDAHYVGLPRCEIMVYQLLRMFNIDGEVRCDVCDMRWCDGGGSGQELRGYPEKIYSKPCPAQYPLIAMRQNDDDNDDGGETYIFLT